MLELNIEYRDRMIHLKVPDNQSIQVKPRQKSIFYSNLMFANKELVTFFIY